MPSYQERGFWADFTVTRNSWFIPHQSGVKGCTSLFLWAPRRRWKKVFLSSPTCITASYVCCYVLIVTALTPVAVWLDHQLTYAVCFHIITSHWSSLYIPASSIDCHKNMKICCLSFLLHLSFNCHYLFIGPLKSEVFSTHISHGRSWWFESGQMCLIHRAVEMDAWLFLELRKETRPSVVLCHPLACWLMEENVGTNAIPPRCLWGMVGLPLPYIFMNFIFWLLVNFCVLFLCCRPQSQGLSSQVRQI